MMENISIEVVNNNRKLMCFYKVASSYLLFTFKENFRKFENGNYSCYTHIMLFPKTFLCQQLLLNSKVVES